LPGHDDLGDLHAEETFFDPTFEVLVTVPPGAPSGATGEGAFPVALDAVAAETIAGASRLDRHALDTLAADRPEAVASGPWPTPVAEAAAVRVVLKRRMPAAVRRSLRALLIASPPFLRPARWAMAPRRFGI
jgi:hypothetical protein